MYRRVTDPEEVRLIEDSIRKSLRQPLERRQWTGTRIEEHIAAVAQEIHEAAVLLTRTADRERPSLYEKLCRVLSIQVISFTAP